MDFSDFLKQIPKIQNTELHATQSHLKMAPFERATMIKLWDYTTLNPKRAGVMALFYPRKSQTYLALIVRAASGVHASQVAFPGGKYEKEDKILAHTAKRETFEEIGIPTQDIQIIREMSELYVPPSNFLITPFLGFCDKEPSFCPNTNEVSEIIEVPLCDFINLQATLTDIKASYNHFKKIPAYLIDNKIVWGATAMILSELKEILDQNL